MLHSSEDQNKTTKNSDINHPPIKNTRKDLSDFFGIPYDEREEAYVELTWQEKNKKKEQDDITMKLLHEPFDDVFEVNGRNNLLYAMEAEQQITTIESEIAYKHTPELITERCSNALADSEKSVQQRREILGDVDAYLATAGIVVTASLDSPAATYFDNRVDRLAEMRNYMYHRQEKVEHLEIPSHGYMTMPSSHTQNMSYAYKGAVLRGTGTGEHMHYGVRPHVSDYQIPLVRIRTASGWYSYLMLWYKMCPVESDVAAMFEYSSDKGIMMLTSMTRPKTNFNYDLVTYTELGVVEGDAVHLVDAIQYLVREKPIFALKAVRVNDKYEMQISQKHVMFEDKTNKLEDGGVYWCTEREVIRASRLVRPYSHELCNGERKSARSADFRTAEGGLQFSFLILTAIQGGGWYDLQALGVSRPVARIMQNRDSFNSYLPAMVSRFFQNKKAGKTVSLADFESYCRNEGVYFHGARYQYHSRALRHYDFKNGNALNSYIEDIMFRPIILIISAKVMPAQLEYLSRFFKHVISRKSGKICSVLTVRAPMNWYREVSRTVLALGMELKLLGEEDEI